MRSSLLTTIAARKQQGPASENACKPLILIGAEAGIEHASYKPRKYWLCVF